MQLVVVIMVMVNGEGLGGDYDYCDVDGVGDDYDGVTNLAIKHDTTLGSGSVA